MFKKIIGTLVTRIIIAVITLVIVLINARVLGKTGTGTITQVILSITLIQLVSNIIGGPAIVYMVPRSKVISLLVPSVIWAIFVSAAGAYLLDLFRYTRAEGYMVHIFWLSLLLSLASVNQMVLMGKEKIRDYNIVTLIQVLVLFIVLMFMFFVLERRNIASYIIALYSSYGSAMIISSSLMMKFMKNDDRKSRNILRDMLRYGGTMQMGNIFQFFNYRLSYFFVNEFLGKGGLGIFSVANSLSESIWIFGKSISAVQYSRIANEKDTNNAARLTLTFIKLVFVITFAGLLALISLLYLFFPIIFKPEFEPVKYVMLVIAPGILTFSISVVLSPYFSGSGKPIHNTITAGIGFICTLVFSSLLIPRFGLIGAALSASLAYTIATIYQLIVFIKISQVLPKDFLLKRSEILTAYSFFLSLPDKTRSR